MENHGKPWTAQSEAFLLESLKTESIIECASKLKRKVSAVESRLQKIAIELDEKGVSEAEIERITKLSSNVIKKLIYVKGLSNHYAEWDDLQEKWLIKQIKKHGLSKCASLMGRTDAEVHNRLLYIGLNEFDKNKSIPDICTRLCLSEDDFTKKVAGMDEYVKFDDLTKLGNPPYHAVINERRTGVFSNYDVVKFIMNGVKSKYKTCNTLEELTIYIESVSDKPRAKLFTLNTNTLNTSMVAHSPIILSEEQNKVIEDVLSGSNVLLLGSAGCGKSLLIQHITEFYQDNNLNIGVVATTACAALLINGKTIHSYLGIGLAKETPEILANNILYKYKSKVKTLKELDILIIDEVSMLSGELLSKISAVLSIIRSNTKPFGGIQLILCGDFYQLSPVQGSYAFHSDIWESLNLSCHILTKIYRQDGDTVFQEILEREKIGEITDADIKILKKFNG